jgi:general secretion pathway protein E
MKAEPASLEDFDPLPSGKDQYPVDFSQENRAIKLSESDAEVTVGLCDPGNASILSTLRLFHRKKLKIMALDPAEFASWIGKYRGKSEIDQAFASDEDPSVALDRIANDAPVVNYVNGLIIDAIRARASDIHIEGFEEEALVRLRVDGVLSIVDRFPKERFAAVSIRLKLMANLNIMEKRMPQDGRIMADLGEIRVELRVSFVPISRGESIVLRMLGGSSSPRELAALGMDGGDLERIRELLAFPHGLIVVSGPTGSGKTTTLSSMLRELPAEGLKILTIEDPIEYLIPGSCQIQTNEAIGLTFESILRRVLRQDPSVVMVGEIRDADT